MDGQGLHHFQQNKHLMNRTSMWQQGLNKTTHKYVSKPDVWLYHGVTLQFILTLFPLKRKHTFCGSPVLIAQYSIYTHQESQPFQDSFVINTNITFIHWTFIKTNSQWRFNSFDTCS